MMKYLGRMFSSKRGWILLALALCLLGACSRQPAVAPGDLPGFTAYLDGQMPSWLRQYRVPGAALALVEKGELVWVQGYGLADEQHHIPVTADTVFQVASISKAVTSWGVMRLVEAGRLELDAPVERYLTRWHLPPSEYDAQGVTLRRLLSHSAGISLHGYPGLPPGRPLPSLEESLSGENGGAGEVRLRMPPGAQYSYSGGGYTLLQLVIEEVSGEPFVAYMQREILDPLGMEQSSFEWRADLQPVTAVGYDPAGQPYPNYLFTEKAAAGLYTTAADLARFVAAEMSGPHGEPAGRGLLAPQTLGSMFTPVVPLGGIEGKWLGVSMGLGHFIESLPDGARAVSHTGANQGWNLQFLSVPERGSGIVILTNSDQGSSLCVELLNAWGQWQGSGVPTVVRFYQGVQGLVLGLAGVLGVGLVFRALGLARKIRLGTRQWIGRLPAPLTAWGYVRLAFSVLFSALLALGWWMVVHPVVVSLAVRQAAWLTFMVLGWCLLAAVSAFLRPVKA